MWSGFLQDLLKMTALLKQLSRDRLCYECSFTCMHCACVSRVPRAVAPCFYLNTLHKAGQCLLCHTPIIKGFSVFLNHRKNKESTLTKWNDLNLYNCLQVIVKTITLCMKCLVVQDNLAFVKKNMKKSIMLL